MGTDSEHARGAVALTGLQAGSSAGAVVGALGTTLALAAVTAQLRAEVMRRARADRHSRRRREAEMHRTLLVVLPVAVGTAVAALASTTPASAVHGGPATGPRPPAAEVPVPLGHDLRVGWADGHRVIALRIRDGAACPPGRPDETSTAPARIEVTVALPTRGRCDEHERWWTDDLRRPPVAERGQAVTVWVDGMRGQVRGYRV